MTETVLLTKTKIVCTLGPSTASDEILENLVQNGMTVARLNMSHGTLADHEKSVNQVRRVSEKLAIPVGIMVDVPGTKYRTGPIDDEFLNLTSGVLFTLTSRDVVGTPDIVSVLPEGIHRDARVGSIVILNDGLIELKVNEIRDLDVICEIVRGGKLTERKGVVTPGQSPSQVFPDENAIEALGFAAEHKVDFVALSTVTCADDIKSAKKILDDLGLSAHVISKIERVEAIQHFEEILENSDAIMVARGDLGVEVRIAEVPIIQKSLIEKCNRVGKPVITATQMLESMVNSPVPTRAEVTDVANAIYDGTDAIMLSGETSVGNYPVEAVKLMFDVAREAEFALPYDRMIVEKRHQLEPTTEDAISYDACQTAQQLNASLIVAFTESGSTAGRVSKYRPMTPVLALTPSRIVQRPLTLRWGGTPVIVPSVRTVDDFFAVGEEKANEIEGVDFGSTVVLVAGLPIGVPGGTNLLRVLSLTDAVDIR